jgi:hypothetical protein
MAEVYAGDKEENQKWENMMQRLMAEDRHGI